MLAGNACALLVLSGCWLCWPKAVTRDVLHPTRKLLQLFLLRLLVPAVAAATCSCELSLERVVPQQADGVMQVVEEHCLGPGFFDQLQQHFAGVCGPPHNEAGTQRCNLLRQAVEAVLEPPAAAAARLELAFLLWSPDEHWHLPAVAQTNTSIAHAESPLLLLVVLAAAAAFSCTLTTCLLACRQARRAGLSSSRRSLRKSSNAVSRVAEDMVGQQHERLLFCNTTWCLDADVVIRAADGHAQKEVSEQQIRLWYRGFFYAAALRRSSKQVTCY